MTQLGSKLLEKSSPKLTKENCISITDYSMWHSIKFVDVVKEKVGNVLICEWVGKAYEMAILRKSTHYY